jgi:hypothetical protein
MTQASIAIAVALVGLVGVWVGRLMERSNEATKWRRDRCLEAYADVVATCHVVFIEANKTWVMGDPTTQQAIAQHELLISKVTEMDRAGDKASLIGSPEINEAIRRLTDHYREKIARQAIAPKPSTDEWHKIVRDAGELHSIFVQQARKDFGFPNQAAAKDQILGFDDRLMSLHPTGDTQRGGRRE